MCYNIKYLYSKNHLEGSWEQWPLLWLYLTLLQCILCLPLQQQVGIDATYLSAFNASLTHCYCVYSRKRQPKMITNMVVSQLILNLLHLFVFIIKQDSLEHFHMF